MRNLLFSVVGCVACREFGSPLPQSRLVSRLRVWCLVALNPLTMPKKKCRTRSFRGSYGFSTAHHQKHVNRRKEGVKFPA